MEAIVKYIWIGKQKIVLFPKHHVYFKPSAYTWNIKSVIV